MNLFKLSIWTDPEYKTHVIGNLGSIWDVYWNYINSAQSINSKVYFTCLDMDCNMNVDLVKGRQYPVYTDKLITVCNKNYSYIISMVNSFIKN